MATDRELTEVFSKDPDSTEPVGVNWAAYLDELGSGVQILTSTWFVDGDALLTISGAGVLSGRLATQAYLSGGTLGTRYRVTNRIVTNSTTAVIDDRSFPVLIRQK